MNGSGRNRLVISTYTFGPTSSGRQAPRATFTGSWAAFPALATLGAVSVAAVSLGSSVGDGSPSGAQIARSQGWMGAAGAGSQSPQPMLQAMTATSQFTSQVVVGGSSSAGEYAGARPDEPAAALTTHQARVAFVAPAPRTDVSRVSESPDRLLGSTRMAAAPGELPAPVSSGECTASCDSDRIALTAMHEEVALYSPDRSFTDVHVTVQSPTLVGDASSLNTEQLGFSAVVGPQTAPNSSEDVQLAPEALDGQSKSSTAGTAGELELTLADVVAARDGSERSALVAPEVAQMPVEQVAAEPTAPMRVGLDVREHLARIDARYPDNAVVAPAVRDHAADDKGRIAEVEDISVLAEAGGAPLGSSSAVIGEDQLVSVRLGDLISLFQDKLERPLFVWMSTSSAATRFVTPETLAAAGLNVHFDAERRQIVLGVSD
jgi:hypothetical protein